MATPFKCSRSPNRSTSLCKFLLGARSSSGSTLSCKDSPRISALLDRSLLRLRFSVRTWYRANSPETVATLTMRGRTILRAVRIETPVPFVTWVDRAVLGAGGLKLSQIAVPKAHLTSNCPVRVLNLRHLRLDPILGGLPL